MNTITIPAKGLRVNDVIVSTVDGRTIRNTVTSDARALGGTGKVAFGLVREGREPWEGRVTADSPMNVERGAKPALNTSEPFPSANPYEGGRLMTTVNCPTHGCDHRVTVDVRDVEALMAGSLVVMHTATEHWTRVYFGTDPARVQYAVA